MADDENHPDFSDGPTDSQYRIAAEFLADGTVASAEVRRMRDGALVQAWKWITKEEAAKY